MGTALLACFLLLIAFLSLWIFLHKKRNSREKPDDKPTVTYICSDCGEKNCNCYKEKDRQ